MSGGYLPYHLRQGKAIDRQIFIEILSKLNKSLNIKHYTYIGLGGPFLEDFKLLHGHFGLPKMISIELDQHVLERQKFNTPLSCIECQLTTTEQFISEYSSNDNAIFWLDYASPRERYQQLSELYSLVQKLQNNDIIKVTLNADLSTLGKPQKERGEKLKNSRLHRLRSQLSDYLPNNIDIDYMTARGFPEALIKSVERVCHKAAEYTGSAILPIGAFTYKDGQRMLTITMVKVENEECTEFYNQTDIECWELSNKDWSAPIDIDVPSLSIRERLWLDKKLPTEIETIEDELGFQFDSDAEKSSELINNYKKFYRYYPQFSRVLV
ncbi:O-methyltransferase [Saccharospirillum salsuginis]|uniref:Uncharacterized protein n=1 Tax=Saccharospirillum salsuginis TaxID=418750 RepID=A0A918KBF4_9GAMM|nr:O-methyltransferase [Saccharospirillum salsuginis]GGX57417.1 hypothetical protein GCM10007392_26230 [Saccharospirillum salsuginis]